jgi:uncharacterized RDD family membrane protein YckC
MFAPSGRGLPSLIVDCAVLTVLMWPVGGLVYAVARAFVSAPGAETAMALGAIAFFVAFFVVPIALWGKTVGMHVMGIRVVRTADLGMPGFRLALMALMARWGRPMPFLTTVNDLAWRSWMQQSAPAGRRLS